MGAAGGTYVLGKGHEVAAVSGVRRSQQVADEEDHQDQLNGRTDRVVLVARLDVPHEHGRARHLLEGVVDLMDGIQHKPMGIVKFHLATGEGNNWRRRGVGGGELMRSREDEERRAE